MLFLENNAILIIFFNMLIGLLLIVYTLYVSFKLHKSIESLFLTLTSIIIFALISTFIIEASWINMSPIVNSSLDKLKLILGFFSLLGFFYLQSKKSITKSIDIGKIFDKLDELLLIFDCTGSLNYCNCNESISFINEKNKTKINIKAISSILPEGYSSLKPSEWFNFENNIANHIIIGNPILKRNKIIGLTVLIYDIKTEIELLDKIKHQNNKLADANIQLSSYASISRQFENEKLNIEIMKKVQKNLIFDLDKIMVDIDNAASEMDFIEVADSLRQINKNVRASVRSLSDVEGG